MEYWQPDAKAEYAAYRQLISEDACTAFLYVKMTWQRRTFKRRVSDVRRVDGVDVAMRLPQGIGQPLCTRCIMSREAVSNTVRCFESIQKQGIGRSSSL